MWLAFHNDILIHLETSLDKLVNDLLAYLKAVLADTWSYSSHALRGHRTIGVSHNRQRLLYYPCHSATPPCMDGGGSMMCCIIYQDWDAVGGAYAHSHSTLVRYHGVYALKACLALRHGEREHLRVNDGYAVGMRLMRIYQPACTNRQTAQEACLVTSYGAVCSK